MKHKIIHGVADKPAVFEGALDKFREENKVSASYFTTNGRFMAMLYEYTPKSPSARNKNAGSTQTKDAKAGTSGTKADNEGLPTT